MRQLASEFEQARIHKNVQLIIAQSKNALFHTAELVDMAIKKISLNCFLPFGHFRENKSFRAEALLPEGHAKPNPECDKS
jgi:hypothetical protein